MQYLAAFTPQDHGIKEAYIARYTKLLNDPGINNQTILVNDIITGSIAEFVMDSYAEITYWIDKKYWGKGIATQALKTLLIIEKSRPVFGRTAFDNIGSQKVIGKCGFIKTATDKGFANAGGKEIGEINKFYSPLNAGFLFSKKAFTPSL